MSVQRLTRLHRALMAAKQAELARLSATLAEARGHAAEAARLRDEAVAPRDARDAGDMARAALWQAHLTARAQVEESQSRAAELRAGALRPQVATAMGREQAVAGLMDRARAEAARLAAARAETPPPRPAAPDHSADPAPDKRYITEA